MDRSFFLRLFSIFYITVLWQIEVTVSDDGIVMRMVEEPVNMGQWSNNAASADSLTPKVKPSNFSGPPHLKKLMGKCFSVVENGYKYDLCPFKNVTQHEQSHRWNPYSGILGTWQEWVIENNTFVAMKYKHGDDCGEKSRQATVTLQCGVTTGIVAVSEPQTCCYALNLSTPLVCHPHSLLVYPTLTKELQKKWDALEGRLYREEITKQGYNKMLHKVFEEAGLVVDPNVVQEKETKKQANDNNFESLETCQAAYNELLLEVKRLKSVAGMAADEGHRDNDDYEPSVYFNNNYVDDYDGKKPRIDDPFLDTF